LKELYGYCSNDLIIPNTRHTSISVEKEHWIKQKMAPSATRLPCLQWADFDEKVAAQEFAFENLDFVSNMSAS
jgi:hypothetical protein